MPFVRFVRFVKKKTTRQWVLDVSFKAVAGLCMRIGVFRRYELAEEQRARTARHREMDSCVRLSVGVLKLLGMRNNASVITEIKGR